jgi:hypothetical protein
MELVRALAATVVRTSRPRTLGMRLSAGLAKGSIGINNVNSTIGSQVKD